jgi:hypothetical protein
MVTVTNVNIVFLAFIFIWQALRLNILNGIDGAGRLILLSSFLVLILNFSRNIEFRKIFTSNTSVRLWLIWFIYAVVNTVFLYDDEHTEVSIDIFILNRLFVPFFIISIVSSFNQLNLRKVLKYMEIALFVVTLIFILGSDFAGGRFSNDFLNINELVLIVISLVVTIFLRNLVDNKSLILLVTKLVVPTYFIVFAGSRMGFMAYVILLFGFYFCRSSKRNTLFVFQVCLIGFISYFTLHYIAANTLLGERLMMTTEQGANLTENPAEGTIFEYFGDRGGFYIIGWSLFRESFPFGIGLLNYSKTNTFVSHVEYIIHLAELGIFGILLYLAFLRSLWVNLKLKLKSTIQSQYINFGFFILVSIIFCASVLFLYNSYAVAYMFGLIILLSKKDTVWIDIK